MNTFLLAIVLAAFANQRMFAQIDDCNSAHRIILSSVPRSIDDLARSLATQTHRSILIELPLDVYLLSASPVGMRVDDYFQQLKPYIQVSCEGTGMIHIYTQNVKESARNPLNFRFTFFRVPGNVEEFAVDLKSRLEDEPRLKPDLPIPTRETVIVIPDSVLERGYSFLLSVAAQNRIPLGIILDNNVGKEQMCNSPVPVARKGMTLGELIDQLNRAWPKSSVELTDGALNVHPTSISKETSSFLNVVIPKFVSTVSTHNLVSVSLWMHIRAIIAPKEGTLYAGPGTLASEKIQSYQTLNKTVLQNLNILVSKGEDGVWILDPANITATPQSFQMPFQVRDYDAELGVARLAVKCPSQD